MHWLPLHCPCESAGPPSHGHQRDRNAAESQLMFAQCCVYTELPGSHHPWYFIYYLLLNAALSAHNATSKISAIGANVKPFIAIADLDLFSIEPANTFSPLFNSSHPHKRGNIPGHKSLTGFLPDVAALWIWFAFVSCCCFWCLDGWLEMNHLKWAEIISHSVC